jgi:hypothetical protein
MFNVQKNPYGACNQWLKNEGLPTSYKEFKQFERWYHKEMEAKPLHD